MSIFLRMTDIFKANVNDMLDRMEDSEKMVKLMIIEMEEARANEKHLMKHLAFRRCAREDLFLFVGALQRVAACADKYDNILKEEYGSDSCVQAR